MKNICILLIVLLSSITILNAQKKVKYVTSELIRFKNSSEFNLDDLIADVGGNLIIKSDTGDSILISIFNKQKYVITNNQSVAKTREFTTPIRGEYQLTFNCAKVLDKKIYCFWERPTGHYSTRFSKEVLYVEVLDSNLQMLYPLKEICSFNTERGESLDNLHATMQITAGLNGDDHFYVWRVGKDSLIKETLLKSYTLDKHLRVIGPQTIQSNIFQDSVSLEKFASQKIQMLNEHFAFRFSDDNHFCSLIDLKNGQSVIFKLFNDSLKHSNIQFKLEGNNFCFFSFASDKHNHVNLCYSVFDLHDQKIRNRYQQKFTKEFFNKYVSSAKQSWYYKQDYTIDAIAEKGYTSEPSYFVRNDLVIEEVLFGGDKISIIASRCYILNKNQMCKSDLLIFELNLVGEIVNLIYKNRKVAYTYPETEVTQSAYFKDINVFFYKGDTLLLCPTSHKKSRKDDSFSMNEIKFYEYHSGSSLDSNLLFKMEDNIGFNQARGNKLFYFDEKDFYGVRWKYKTNYVLGTLACLGGIVVTTAAYATLFWSLTRLNEGYEIELLSAIVVGGGYLSTLGSCIGLIFTYTKCDNQVIKLSVIK
jgi:hypothetical protein